MASQTFTIDADAFIAEAEMCERCAALSAAVEDKEIWLALASRWRAAAHRLNNRAAAVSGRTLLAKHATFH
ncbi:hypothetical protein GJW-30_1_02045 [Variibacter gotjawalensis]|uniref:Uncharacterized protein n=1 Tax=Variibacter gotjawalensis TaxID=1333996 RepID=A0A0S3PUB5_9BRAD|nr:hypothetical protein [Variibacter gotjawalensis]NIK49837.1 hypothetical protein [Variibacter gotjawalensis]RZS45836.1 hypothetical protein EV661_4162 [Variibacter gotjawalensis]BAT59512.1 hypothetical protein GJW-30_1_02045 [Variibacter gotjawalensis]